jgi:hypothetical protein
MFERTECLRKDEILVSTGVAQGGQKLRRPSAEASPTIVTSGQQQIVDIATELQYMKMARTCRWNVHTPARLAIVSKANEERAEQELTSIETLGAKATECQRDVSETGQQYKGQLV